ncbi:MAG: type I 3-dehydroquinate dehydratase [Phycisphaerae bacterium]|nr:type I 3-dehydroquinate dehydratase [Phycisphaerae bacterium]
MPETISKTALIVPLTQSTAGQMRQAMRKAAEAGADMVECRLDYLADPPDEADLKSALKDRPVPVIVTCRPTRQGGRFAGDESDRLDILATAARLGADYIDVELDVPPSRRPKGRTILSHHDFTGRPADLDKIVAELNASQADVSKIVFSADGPEDALAALSVLPNATKPTVALAMGEAGLASRILARKFGAFGTFAALGQGEESAPGQLTIEQMKRLYRWDSVGPATCVYGVIGCPITHSMSPAIHNAAFAAGGIDAVYVPLLIESGAENFNRFMDAVAPWTDLRGLSVTIPHKENAIARAGTENIDELSRRIGAINTVAIADDGSLSGTNTDYAAAIDALCSAMEIGRSDLAGRKVAVIGAGGVARAITAALRHYRADVTVYNRTFSRAEKLAAEFGGYARPLDEIADLSSEIVINCTSI